jgi:hypothetical protein
MTTAPTLESRLLGLVRQVNKLLVAGDREGDLFPKVCRAIVKEAGFAFAWVGYRDRVDESRIVVMGRAGHAAPPNRHAFSSPDGAAGQALIEGKPVVGSRAGRSDGTELALPLSLGESTIGILVIGLTDDTPPASETVLLLEGLATLMVRSIVERKAEVELRHAQRISDVFLASSKHPCLPPSRRWRRPSKSAIPLRPATSGGRRAGLWQSAGKSACHATACKACTSVRSS